MNNTMEEGSADVVVMGDVCVHTPHPDLGGETISQSGENSQIIDLNCCVARSQST